MSDLLGHDAERTVPPYMQGVLIVLRGKGHTVVVRKSERNGSWYYSVDNERERRGMELCNRFKVYGV